MPTFENPIKNSQCLCQVIVNPLVASKDPKGNEIIPFKHTPFGALIDTGATNTCISSAIVKQCAPYHSGGITTFVVPAPCP